MASKAGKYKLEIPLDASGVRDFKPTHPVKVVAYERSGKVAGSEVVKLNEGGHGVATLTFDSLPGATQIVVGPADATDEDLKGLQTLTLSVPSNRWKEDALRLSPIAISSFYWWWWIRWCQRYVIRGRLVCADGSPVPGAKVCAYDVDWWWWWISEEQVGCAVTDANGVFEIDFRRCCGWWWWWWWERRFWRFESLLADKIVPPLQKVPGIKRIPIPDPAPDLAIFEALINDLSGESRALAPIPGGRNAITPSALESIRTQLIGRLPEVTAVERLRLWPWFPWFPWWDCDADIIFRATQDCNGQSRIILEESIFQVRLDIPTQLNVTLVANNQACCLAPPCQNPADCPEGSCLVPFDMCNVTSAGVGGNPGASTNPALIGYENPGGAAPGFPWGDRPFAGAVTLASIFGASSDVDYYEFEYTTTPGIPASWSAMPIAAFGGFYRAFWTPLLTQQSVPFFPAPINSPVGPRNVLESRQHYETNNSIGIGWDAVNFHTMMNWLTDSNFGDDTYYLRLKGWKRPGYAGDLSDPRVLPFCDTDEDNYLVITVDNRVEGAASGHPLDHPCGSGTVHVCTKEPDCNIFSVLIDGAPIAACGSQKVTGNETVEIDLMVNDPDGHLAYYTLDSNWGLNQTISVISLSGHLGTLAPGPGPTLATSGISPATQVGPDYGRALAQGATAPNWNGGTVRLTAKVSDIFPETCCYQLQLWAYKRTIVGCGDTHRNVTELSFTIIYA
jgi:hypothetical protein